MGRESQTIKLANHVTVHSMAAAFSSSSTLHVAYLREVEAHEVFAHSTEAPLHKMCQQPAPVQRFRDERSAPTKSIPATEVHDLAAVLLSVGFCCC